MEKFQQYESHLKSNNRGSCAQDVDTLYTHIELKLTYVKYIKG